LSPGDERSACRVEAASEAVGEAGGATVPCEVVSCLRGSPSGAVEPRSSPVSERWRFCPRSGCCGWWVRLARRLERSVAVREPRMFARR
jgi:hypothetical protein